MDFKLNSYGNMRYPVVNYGKITETARMPHDIAFKGDLTGSFIKSAEKGFITLSNAQKVTDTIDSVLGDRYFSSILDKANITVKDDTIFIPNDKLSSKIFETVKYPFFDLPRDLMIFILKPLSKKGPLQSLATGALEGGFLKSRINEKELQKNLDTIREIVDHFAYKSKDKELSLLSASSELSKNAAEGITRIQQNYSTRDERTLNRMVTSSVSALYSANDFYNISMLQKDDDTEAKKAKRGRFKQEMTRMALNVGLTFLTLGILGKFIKKNVVLNSAVIALSALISEVTSRVWNKVPLHPLTPEQAEKIAKAQQIEPQTPTATRNQGTYYKLRNNIDETPFKSFQNPDGTLEPINSMMARENQKPDEQKEPQKKLNFKNILLLAFGISSGVYLLSKKGPLKGGFSKVSELSQNLKDALTTKKHEINLDELATKIRSLKELPEGKEIEKMLDEFGGNINFFTDGKTNNITVRKNRFLLPGIYSGLTKIFSTLYQILSAPGRLINGMIDKLNSDGKVVEKYTGVKSKAQAKKELAALDEIFEKEKTPLNQIEQIKKRIRNIETAPETGELASMSRTLVTAISTYFFVNDYTNKVLIESQGRDLEQAREERNERIAHKVSNFFFNGMLMNLFNSVFKKSLNNSLWQAGLIAGATETVNEFLVRKSICQPTHQMKSKQDILDYEDAQLQKKGLIGVWSRFFRRITGKKTLTQKAGIDTNQNK